jgi:hypothetical protein
MNMKWLEGGVTHGRQEQGKERQEGQEAKAGQEIIC